MAEIQQQAQPQTFLGMPMSWDWDLNKIMRNYWNPDDDRVFPPKVFGIGWDVNFYQVYRRMGVLAGPGGNGDASGK
jgi:hypothetical protein